MSNLPNITFSNPFSVPQLERERLLIDGLNALTRHHRGACNLYGKMIQAVYGEECAAETLSEVPYLPVRLFKHELLKSVGDSAVVRQLASSGTSGQELSRIFIDAETSALQIKALAAIMQQFIGGHRLPMLIIDKYDTVDKQLAFSARAAGILGFSNFGRQHTYALNSDMSLKWDEIHEFIMRNHGAPILLFGFTFVIWQYFLQAARSSGRKLDFGANSILIHGGGWKKLTDQSVDNNTFKKLLADQFGIGRTSNYYGMVEQVGSIFMECEAGYFHAPSFSEVLIRDPISLEPATSGVVQVLSLLPRSYPGHAILTEDMGTIIGIDDCLCGRRGKYFCIHGRIPKAELRGCSDVIVT